LAKSLWKWHNKRRLQARANTIKSSACLNRIWSTTLQYISWRTLSVSRGKILTPYENVQTLIKCQCYYKVNT